MPPKAAIEALTAVSTHERATPSLVYRSLLKSIHDGHMVPGAKLPNERDLALQLAVVGEVDAALRTASQLAHDTVASERCGLTAGVRGGGGRLYGRHARLGSRPCPGLWPGYGTTASIL